MKTPVLKSFNNILSWGTVFWIDRNTVRMHGLGLVCLIQWRTEWAGQCSLSPKKARNCGYGFDDEFVKVAGTKSYMALLGHTNKLTPYFFVCLFIICFLFRVNFYKGKHRLLIFLSYW